MEQERISVPALNKFARAYISGSKEATGYFDYKPFSQSAFAERAADLQSQSFQRAELAEVIKQFMKPAHWSEQVEQSLEKLKNPLSAVVIGGQQAGLLTGPLYTIHKIISILHVAKEQERKLDIPVVPVFWIAGEDHDLQEINHLFVEQNGQMHKLGYPERFMKKQAASHTVYNKEIMQSWVTSVFASLEETAYTNTLLDHVQQAVVSAQTFTEFFSSLIGELFSKHGLLIVDAADSNLRRLEAPFFKQLIEQNDELGEAVQVTQQSLSAAGFNPAIETGDNPAHLFLIEEGERHLLEKKENFFSSKSGRSYTKTELLQLLETAPERFSNNVVTRPLMQEKLFPTLAFIAGPGEIAYWAELQQAFHHFGMKMPVVLPRVNITIVDRTVARIAAENNIALADAVKNGVQKQKAAYVDLIRDHHLHDLINKMKQELFENYVQIESRASKLHKGLQPIIEKNKQYHERQIDFLVQKSDAILEQTHQAALLRYDHLQNALCPEGPQERIWNVYFFLNRYGPEFIDQLINQSYEHNGDHYLLYV